MTVTAMSFTIVLCYVKIENPLMTESRRLVVAFKKSMKTNNFNQIIVPLYIVFYLNSTYINKLKEASNRRVKKIKLIIAKSYQIVKNSLCHPPRRCWVRGTRSSPRRCRASQLPPDILIASPGAFFERGKYLGMMNKRRA